MQALIWDKKLKPWVQKYAKDEVRPHKLAACSIICPTSMTFHSARGLRHGAGLITTPLPPMYQVCSCALIDKS